MIMYYICKRDNDRALAETCVGLLAPWIMGQHFNTRIMAQIVIYKLITDFDLYTNLLIYQSIQTSFEQKNAKIISQSYLQDFRFVILDYKDLLNPVYYLCEIPRITKMALDERIPLQFVPKNYHEKVISRSLIDYKMFGKVYGHIICDESNDVDIENIQKKITPLREIIPDFNHVSALPDHILERKKVFVFKDRFFFLNFNFFLNYFLFTV